MSAYVCPLCDRSDCTSANGTYCQLYQFVKCRSRLTEAEWLLREWRAADDGPYTNLAIMECSRKTDAFLAGASPAPPTERAERYCYCWSPAEPDPCDDWKAGRRCAHEPRATPPKGTAP